MTGVEGADSGQLTLLQMLPTPVRRVIEAILLTSTLIGALTSIFVFLSFMARLFWWHDLWIQVEIWAHKLPHDVLMCLQWTGWAIHRIVAAYRDTIYPLVNLVTRYLPFHVAPWAIDAFFITVFSLISAWRIRTHSFMFGEGLRFWREYGIYLPFWLIAQLGTSLIFLADRVIAFVTFRVIRISSLYDMLPNGLDDFVFGALAVSAVLLAFLGIDQAYLFIHPR